jgi:hypothetical protein
MESVDMHCVEAPFGRDVIAVLVVTLSLQIPE